MTKKIFRSVFLLSSVLLFACLAMVMGVLYNHFSDVQKQQLKTQTSLIAQGVEDEGQFYLERLQTDGYRLTWVASDGTVLYDSEADASLMENHSHREEIQEALESGSGESERTSSTLSEKTFYRAKRLADGSVLRVSVTQYTVVKLLFEMLPPILLILVSAILFSGFLAARLAKRIVGPLNKLNLEKPLENDAYEELSPLLIRIETQHREITKQMEALNQKQEEFLTVTRSMSEGLILLNENGIILSINPAAAKLFQTDLDCVGRDLLTVDRSLSMQNLIQTAKTGKSAQGVLPLAGGNYQVHASPVLSEEIVTGICILAFDITEKQEAEKQRREFSANVSHELKTPLQSILGSAELLENNLVKPADIPRFVTRIHTEARRLLLLIDDIIRLSQLDEGDSLPEEEVSLTLLAKEALDSLSKSAAEKNITLNLTGEEVTLTGAKHLLYEIVYNLCDNAVKYNRENGRVDVNVSRGEKGILLSVSDTGIGIPLEQQSRVFERFYRVDQSHSKETGGTGLGLSIVKHAAIYHHATIELTSTAEKGTTVSIQFPQ